MVKLRDLILDAVGDAYPLTTEQRAELAGMLLAPVDSQVPA